MFQFLSRVSGIASHTKQKQRPASSTSTSIVDPPLHCKPPSHPPPYIGLCKFICGDFALAPN